MPTKTICAMCNQEAVNEPYGIGFYHGDSKAYDKVCSTCFDKITNTWITKPQFQKK